MRKIVNLKLDHSIWKAEGFVVGFILFVIGAVGFLYPSQSITIKMDELTTLHGVLVSIQSQSVGKETDIVLTLNVGGINKKFNADLCDAFVDKLSGGDFLVVHFLDLGGFRDYLGTAYQIEKGSGVICSLDATNAKLVDISELGKSVLFVFIIIGISMMIIKVWPKLNIKNK